MTPWQFTELQERTRELARSVAVELAIARFAQLEQAGREASMLRRALEDRKTIDRVKGLLMDRLASPRRPRSGSSRSRRWIAGCRSRPSSTA